ncbi:hypothetical protein LWI28_016121, partial [Acer negundo]
PSWVTDEEFGMGYLELKPAPSLASKSLAGNGAVQNGSALNVSQNEIAGGKTASMLTQHADSGHSFLSLLNVYIALSTVKASAKRSVPTGSLTKTLKQDLTKDDNRSGKAAVRSSGTATSDRDLPLIQRGRQGGANNASSAVQVTLSQFQLRHFISLRHPALFSRSAHSPRHDTSAVPSKPTDKVQKRSSPADDTDRSSKRYKGDTESRDFDERERSVDPRYVDLEKIGTEEQMCIEPQIRLWIGPKIRVMKDMKGTTGKDLTVLISPVQMIFYLKNQGIGPWKGMEESVQLSEDKREVAIGLLIEFLTKLRMIETKTTEVN